MLKIEQTPPLHRYLFMDELIQNSFNAPTMSSREIATLCDKEHRNVCRDIENLNLEYGKLSLLKVGETPYTHENEDYLVVQEVFPKMGGKGGRPKTEYYLTLDMAKHKPFQMRLSNRRKH